MVEEGEVEAGVEAETLKMETAVAAAAVTSGNRS